MDENPTVTLNEKREACQRDPMEKHHLGGGTLCSGQSTALELGDRGSYTSSVTD